MADESAELFKLMALEKAGILTDQDEEQLSKLLAVEANAILYQSFRKVEGVIPEAFPPMEIAQSEKDRLFAERMGTLASSAKAPSIPRPTARPEGRTARLWLRVGPYASLAAVALAVVIGKQLAPTPEPVVGGGGGRYFECNCQGAVREVKGTLQEYELSDIQPDFIQGYLITTYDPHAVGLVSKVPFQGKLCTQKGPAGCEKWEEAQFDLVYRCEKQREGPRPDK